MIYIYSVEKKIKYIEKAGRKLIVEFFKDGSLKAVNEWTNLPSAAYAVKLSGERYANAVLFLALAYSRKAYQIEFARLRRKYGREYVTVEKVNDAKNKFDSHSTEQKALSAINAPCFMLEPCFERSLIMQI